MTYFSEPCFHVLSSHEYTKLAIYRFHKFLPIPRLVPRIHTNISCTTTQIKTFYVPRLSIDLTRLYRFGRLRLPTLDVRGKILKRIPQFGVSIRRFSSKRAMLKITPFYSLLMGQSAEHRTLPTNNLTMDAFYEGLSINALP